MLSFDEDRVAVDRLIMTACKSLRQAPRRTALPRRERARRNRGSQKRSRACAHMAQTFRGSTIMRPCISMCIAWQNQVQ